VTQILGAALGDGRLAELRAQGAAMSIDETVAFALAELQGVIDAGGEAADA